MKRDYEGHHCEKSVLALILIAELEAASAELTREAGAAMSHQGSVGILEEQASEVKKGIDLVIEDLHKLAKAF